MQSAVILTSTLFFTLVVRAELLPRARRVGT